MRRFLAPTLSLALALTAAPAEAQLGKLKKLGSDIAKEAGREAVGLPPKKESSKDTESSPSGGKAPVDYVLTAERTMIVLAALAPLVEEARKDAAVREMETSYKSRMTALEKCATDAAKGLKTMNQAYLDNGGKITEKQSAVMMRYSNALQAGRKREAAFTMDTASVLTYELQMLMTGAKCGPIPYRPAALIEAELAREAASTGEVDENGPVKAKYEVPESARKGLTTRQFGVMRERLAIYALELTRPGGSPSSLNGFNDAERGALDARAGDLKAMAPFFRDGMLRWATWGDLKSW